MGDLALGIALNLGGSVITSFGMSLQKVAHNYASENKIEGTYFKQPKWLVGFVVFIFGQFTIMGSLSFAPLALLSLVTSVQLVSNAIFAYIFFGEAITLRDILATLLIGAGCALGATYCPKQKEGVQYTADDFSHSFGNGLFMAYFILSILSIFVCFAINTNSVEGMKVAPSTSDVQTSYGIIEEDEQEEFKFNDQAEENFKRPSQIFCCKPDRSIVYALLAANVGSYVTLFASMCTHLISTTTHGANQFTTVFTYVCFIALIVTALSNIHFINVALQSGNIVVALPTYYVVNVILTMISGMLFYQTYQSFETVPAVLFAIGVLLTVVGVILITQRPVPEDTTDEAIAVEVAPREGTIDPRLLRNASNQAQRISMLRRSLIVPL